MIVGVVVAVISYCVPIVFGFVDLGSERGWRAKVTSPQATADPSILEGLASALEKKRRPNHVALPRRRVDLPFAVQLMRASYNAIDWLNCTPMDEFQRSFFLFRQSEWEDYRKYHPQVFQGDLSDPAYFDFISFAQYAVISNKINDGLQEFVEKFNAAGDTQVVRRDPSLQNNSILPIVHSRAVGQRILDFLYEKYPSLMPAPLKQGIDPLDVFVTDAQAVLDIFLINSFSSGATITTVPHEKQTEANKDTCLLRMTLTAPATLWSTQVLTARRDSPVNDFEVKVLQELARRRGLELTTMTTNVENSIDVQHFMKLSRAEEPYKKLELWPQDENFVPIKEVSFQLQEEPLKGKQRNEEGEDT